MFDPTTTDLIGTSEVNLVPDADYPAGAVIESEARTTQIVDQLHPTEVPPPPGQGNPMCRHQGGPAC